MQKINYIIYYFRKTVRNIVSILLFAAFCYLMTVFNLYKSLERWEFNIWKSGALKEFIFFVGIILPLIFIFRVFRKRYEKRKKNEHRNPGCR